MIIGLTGSMGAGKSTVTKIIMENYDLDLFDCDAFTRTIGFKGDEVYENIISLFDKTILDEDGNIIRKKLSDLVFSDSNKLHILEDITVPVITDACKLKIEESNQKGRNLLLDVPMLYEYDLHHYCTKRICVGCSLETTIERCLKRGWTKEQVQARLDNQWCLQNKINVSDYLIWNDYITEETLRKTVCNLFDQAKLWKI